ncbi:MAG TPA: PAS domain S-box protein, partial [Bacteroidales bacterium]|nr:PAS domain S-box protein [Bacteroidales bacterium]
MSYQQSILDTIEEPASFVDKEFTYVYVNKAYGHYYGFEPGDIEGMAVADLLGEEYFNKYVKPHFAQCLKGEQIHFEEFVPSKNGKGERFLVQDYYPHYNKDNEIDGIVSTAKDRTDFYTLNKNWTSAMDAIDDIVCMVDNDYNIIDINRYGLDFIQKSKADVVGKKCYQVLHGSNEPGSFCPVKACLKSRKTERSEIFDEHHDKYLSIKTSPIFSSDGELVRFIDVMHDITPVKEKETLLKEVNEEYLSANEELSEQNEDYLALNKKLEILNRNYDLVNQYSSDVIAMYDEHFKTLYVSPSTINYIGYTALEFQKINVFDLVHPGDRQRLKREIVAFKKRGIRNYTNTYRIKHKKGHYFWNETVSHVVKENERTFIVVNSRNIDQRKKAELAVEQARRRYNEAERIAHLGSWEMEIQTGKTFWSDEFFRICGFEPGSLEPSSEKGFEIIHPDDRKRAGKAVEDSIASGKPYKIEKRIVRPDGEVRWVRSEGTVEYAENKKPKSLIGSFLDITESKIAKEELKFSEAKYKAAFHTSPDSVNINKMDGEFVEINQGFTRLTGFTEADVIGKLSSEIDIWSIPEDRERLISGLKKDGIVENLESIFRAKDGTLMPALMSAQITELNGEPHILSVTRAIVERKRMEEEIIRAKDKAEEANRLKTEFLNNMSHEVRTPMNGIVGFSELLNRPGISEEKRKNYTKIVRNSSEQLLRIIDDILEISSLETRQKNVVKISFSLNYLLMELFSIFSIEAKERDIPLYIKKANKDSDSYIITDKSKLHKILSNLIENALRYTTSGHIEIGYYISGESLVIYVNDTGIGISPENQEMIFERFAQEDKDISRKRGGLGLGLSISKENAELLGGDITLISEKGKGSTFSVTIPYKPAENDGIPHEGSPSKIGSANKNQERVILVAEDEEVNYLYIEALIEEDTDSDLSLLHARNGEEAVRLAQEIDGIEMVLLDIKMPVMNGLEAAKKIKKKKPDLPIIAQTAYSTESDRMRALESGCNDFISKPWSKEKLFRLLKKYL